MDTKFSGNKLGVIAGSGVLPFIVIKNAKKLFSEVVIFFITENNPQKIDNQTKHYFIEVGKIGKLLKLLKKEGIKNIVFSGKVEKRLIFQKLKFDLVALRLLFGLKQKTDSMIMVKIINFFKSNGINTLPQPMFLKNYLSERGILGKWKPNKDQLEDIEYGYKIAKMVATLDIGQTIIVKSKTILAIEGIEGTDATIRRIKKFGIKDSVVIKVSRKKQDLRFDIPAVGLKTLLAMKKSNCNVLSVEAGKVFLVEKEKMIKFADKNKICIIGF